VDNFYTVQHDDGFICREIDIQGHDRFHRHDPNSAAPNILTWAEWRYYRLTGDDARLKEAFWPLLAYHRWLQKNRTWPDGLYWATGMSSGMSNQTRITGHIEESMYHHCHWSWVDANMEALLDSWILAQVAVVLGETELAESLAREHHQLMDQINGRLWNEERGFYQDIDPSGEFSAVKSIGAYWGLLAQGLVTKDRLNTFIKHLYESDRFKRPHRVPSQSADSPGYDPDAGAHWRGGVWSPTNYMLLKGLRANGRHLLAHEIALNHLENVGRIFERTGTFWENYEPESAAPGQPAEPDYVGWSGLTPISILLEDVIGIMVDWPQRRVTWDRRYKTDAFYGVRNYPIGQDGVMDLIGDKETITITTTVPLTLVIQDDEANLQTAVPVGSTEIDL
jgi:glycogen debranching enzyme